MKIFKLDIFVTDSNKTKVVLLVSFKIFSQLMNIN